jgi:hypothetical protein
MLNSGLRQLSRFINYKMSSSQQVISKMPWAGGEEKSQEGGSIHSASLFEK